MNALTTQLAPTSGASAMIPRNMRDAMELAGMMAKTGFLPKEIQSPGGALFVMEQAMRWNMSPFAVATEVSFIQGKPMFSGKIVAAAVQSSGVLEGRLSYDYSGSGDDMTVIVRGTIRGEGQPREVGVRLGDAKTNNKVWQTQPQQQLAYHGARVWARRHTPEVMLGVYAPEEFEEAAQAPPREVPSTVVDERPPAPAGSLRETAQALVTYPVLNPSGDLVRVPKRAWLRAIEKAAGAMEDDDALRAYRAAMGEHLATVAEDDADLVTQAEELINARLLALADATFPGEVTP